MFHFFNQLPKDMQGEIINKLERQDQAKLARVCKSLNNIVNGKNTELSKYKENNKPIHPLVRDIKDLLETYQQKRGKFRKFFNSNSRYIDDLTAFYNNVKNKKELTKQDVKGLYELYTFEKPHNSPYMWGSDDLSPVTFRKIRSLLGHYFPLESEIGKAYRPGWDRTDPQ